MEEAHNERLLSDALRTLAADEAQKGPSASVEVVLRGEVRALARARRAARVKLSMVAIALLGTVSGLVWSARSVPSRASTRAPELVFADATQDFLPLTYSTVPMTSGEIIRLEVPATALEAFGVDPAHWQYGSRTGTVLADVLVGDDGLARGVRFVRDTTR